MVDANLMEKIVSLAKRRGFVFPGSEIYGGLAGTYDYGPLGAELSHNVKDLWWKHFVSKRDEMFGLASSVLMPEAVWAASGHLDGFTDPMVECKKCHHRFRADHLYTEFLAGITSEVIIADKNDPDLQKKIKNVNIKCPDCGGELGNEKAFGLMFPVGMGSSGDGVAYLRGEIAQGMFVNFKNVLDTMRPKLPFGIAQIGKAFRNEIAPRDFLFRVREFDLMEFEYFVRENDWERAFEEWRNEMWAWIDLIGVPRTMVHELEIVPEDRAHYSKRTIDFEFDFPFGKKELYGLAYRTDYDLKKHAEHSHVDLQYTEEDGSRFIPHVIEPTFGLGRTVLAILTSAYREDSLGGETRTYLALSPKIAPIKAMVSPLLKNKPELVAKAREVRKELQKIHPAISWDDNGNIGKRYRRQDEIGTPFCITIDFDTLGEKPELKDTVTLRHRDTGEQERLTISQVAERIRTAIE